MKHFRDTNSNTPSLNLDLKQLPELPNIDLQIEYVNHIRKVVIPTVKPLGSEMVMIFAIEQSLLAAKRYGQSRDKSEIERECQKILYSFDIALTSLRVEVLKTILAQSGGNFTISEIHSLIPRRKAISKPAVTAAIDLFKKRGILLKQNNSGGRKSRGRPEEIFKYCNHMHQS